MSGKHVRVRAWRSGVGTPVLTVLVGLVAWVAIGVLVALAPHSQPAELGGSAHEGDPHSSSVEAAVPDASPEGPSGAAAEPSQVDPSPPAPAPSGRGGADDSRAGVEPVEPATTADADVSTVADAPSSPESSPWEDAPGKAKGHDKRRDRDPR